MIRLITHVLKRKGIYKLNPKTDYIFEELNLWYILLPGRL